jgi:hypothetical protein
MNVNVNVTIKTEKQSPQPHDVVFEVKILPQTGMSLPAMGRSIAQSIQRSARRNA